MSIHEFVNFLRQYNIYISLRGENLKIDAPKNVLTPEIVGKIKSRKQELIDFLSSDIVSVDEFSEQKDFHELSNAQKRLWFLDNINADKTAYNMSGAFFVTGNLSVMRLQQAVNKVVEEQESLRTVFVEKNGEPFQKIIEKFDFRIQNDSYLENLSSENAIEEAIAENNQFIFNLSSLPLFRIRMVKITNDKNILLINMHHIISDEWSVNIFFQRISELYKNPQSTNNKSITEYWKYAVWHRKQIEKSKGGRHKDFWVNYLSGEISPAIIQRDKNNTGGNNNFGQTDNFLWSKKQAKMVSELAKEMRCSEYVVLLALVNVLIYKYSGQNDVIVGTPFSGRTNSHFDNTIGFFVNTLPVRNFVDTKLLFSDFVNIVRQNVMQVIEHQDYPFDKIVSNAKATISQTQNPYFELLVAYESSDVENFALDGVAFQEVSSKSTTSKFDISLMFAQSDGKISLDIEYRTDLYSQFRISQVFNHLTKLIENVILQREKTIGQLNFTSAYEISEIFRLAGNPISEIEESVCSTFQRQAKQTPNAIAVEFGDTKLTYIVLLNKSKQLANQLIKLNIENETPVSVLLPNSEIIPVVFLGILFSNYAFLPLNSNYPTKRIESLMKDCKSSVLITTKQFAKQHSFSAEIEILEAENLLAETTDIQEITINVTPQSLAYIMYTSGSTGTPKGVMIEHRSIVRLTREANYFDFGKKHKILATGSLAFDASTFEIWGSLLNGGTIVFADKDSILNPRKLHDTIINHSITALWFTAGFFNSLVDVAPEIFGDLQCVLTGGERLSVSHVNKIKNKYPSLILINGYGPTENTTFTTTFNISRSYDDDIPIGKPISGSNVFILDKDNNPLPVDFIGELCTSGNGLARGYINDNQLTTEKFIHVGAIGKVRVYKTGDLAKIDYQGNVHFVGRTDNQLKIRGYRIETSEIESVIQNHKSVVQIVVLPKKNNDKLLELCAYLVVNKDITVEALTEFAGLDLPNYMVPAHFIFVDKMPLNSNGKIYKTKLLAIEIKHKRKQIELNSPSEKIVAQAFAEVLDVAEVFASDNFFALGGHSLKAVRLMAILQKKTKSAINVSNIFANPEVCELAKVIEKQKQKAEIIPNAPKLKNYHLSVQQQQMWLMQTAKPESVTYNMPALLKIEGKIIYENLETALKNLIQRYGILRTSFVAENGMPRQKISPEIVFQLKKLSFLDKEFSLQKLMQIVDNELDKPFNLSKPPLFRVTLAHWSNKNQYLIFNAHHIISDAWSQNIFIRELSTLYSGHKLQLPEKQYVDYAHWQNSFLKTEMSGKQKKFWLDKLSGFLPRIDFPTDFRRPEKQIFSGTTLNFNFGKEKTRLIRAYIAKEETTLFVFLYSILKVLLFRWTQQSDFVIGVPTSGRHNSLLTNQIGYFLNVLLARDLFSAEISFTDFLEQMKKSWILTNENLDYPLIDLIDELDFAQDGSRNPVFDVMLLLQNVGQEEVKLGNSKISSVDLDTDTAKMDLTFTFWENDENIELALNYNTGLFKNNRVQQLGNQFLTLTENCIKNSSTKISEIEFISEEELERVGNVFSGQNKLPEYKLNTTVFHEFEKQARKNPDRIVISTESAKYTYRQVYERSSEIATFLYEEKLATKRIGLLFGRSPEMLITMLAVMKSGCVYVPISPEFPSKRIISILQQADIEIVIGDSANVAHQKLPPQTSFILFDEIEKHNVTSNYASPKSPAYVIFTSGSTGYPKGVEVRHESLVNRLLAMEQIQQISENAVWLNKTIYTFDVSAWEIFWAIMRGGKVAILRDKAEKSPLEIIEFIINQRVSHCYFVPSSFSVFLEAVEYHQDRGKLDCLKCIIVSGEVLTPKNVIDFRKLLKPIAKDVKLYNTYGPSESLVVSCFDTDFADTSKPIPIGQPYSYVELFLCDNKLRLVPQGAVGELVIGGRNLSNGYVNNVKLTKQKFVEHIFSAGKKVFRTGDLAKWDDSGQLQFLGRSDNQVKIRGHRIEPSEIANVLERHKSVRQAVVVSVSNQETELVAYYILSSQVREDLLRDYLSRFLPAYMIPMYMLEIESFPRTTSGKIALRELPPVALKATKKNVLPFGKDEIALVEIWKEVLRNENIGVTDDFFKLGGHSLKAAQITTRFYQATGKTLDIGLIFSNPTIRQLAACVTNSEKSGATNIRCRAEQEDYEMSHAQSRLWFLDSLKSGRLSYIMPATVYLHGKVEVDIFEDTLRQIINRHESLRTAFIQRGDEIRQKILKESEVVFQLQRFDYQSVKAVEDMIFEEQRRTMSLPFDLSSGQLFRASIYQIESKKFVFMMTMHHIISDGWSVNVFLNELLTIYDANISKKSFPLSALKIQYKDYAAWQNENISEIDKDFWIKQLRGKAAPVNFRYDFKPKPDSTFEGALFHGSVPRNLAENLSKIAQKNDTTLSTLIFSVFCILLNKLSGNKQITVALATANRANPDVEKLIGFFVNLLVISVDMSENKSFGVFLKDISSHLANAYRHQNYPLDLIVEKINPSRENGQQKLFNVGYSFRNYADVNLGVSNMQQSEFKHFRIEAIDDSKNRTTAKFELLLFAEESDGELILSLEYNKSLFSESSIGKYMGALVSFLSAIAKS